MANERNVEKRRCEFGDCDTTVNISTYACGCVKVALYTRGGANACLDCMSTLEFGKKCGQHGPTLTHKG